MAEPPRRPGRPPLDPDDPSVPVHVKLPSKQYDLLYERARQERTTIPELVRRALRVITDERE
jgi:hypothetical protein